MINRISRIFVFSLVFLFACKSKSKEKQVKQTRTSGVSTVAVDATLDQFLKSQVEVFKSDYPEADIKTIIGNENELMPKFAKGELKMLVLTRMLKPKDSYKYIKENRPIYTDRIAVDGLAVIAKKNNLDSTVTVQSLYDIMKGLSKTHHKLVFDNAYSSTIRYFIDSAGISTLPKEGVYTLNSTNEVIDFVTKNQDYYGIVGVNWLLEKQKKQPDILDNIQVFGVKNIQGKIGSDRFYKPSQENLINGKYPFLRNIYIINAEGTNGVGTGFANWLASPRGQLIVLKSGLAPHEIAERELNFKTNKKK